jgi:hypothetical protein
VVKETAGAMQLAQGKCGSGKHAARGDLLHGDLNKKPGTHCMPGGVRQFQFPE